MPRPTSKSARSTSPRPLGRKDRVRPSAQVADELMELAVDAAESRNLPEFLDRFAHRAAPLLEASWCGVLVFRGRETDLYQAPSNGFRLTPAQHAAVIRLARDVRREVTIAPLHTLDGCNLTPSRQIALSSVCSRSVVSDESLGCLCIVKDQEGLGSAMRRLLHALASHLALSLENFRRFSQLERSKRQWVEDIDAISDFIVVHDRSWRIVRTNRSLSSHLGVPPVALVGEAMSTLRQIAETGHDMPCPFCRNTLQPREEYVVASPERIFLISTLAPRTTGLSDDDTRTIHVLKDITDRREAERRYRELFDSIQEGLFFATPEGRFLDVNDAMVRMLGYDSRDELLRADVGPHLYPVADARERTPPSRPFSAGCLAELRRNSSPQGRYPSAYPPEHHRRPRPPRQD